MSDFDAAWADFKVHRQQIRKKMTPLAEERLLKKLGKYDESVAVKAIEQSIENGWQGVFPERLVGKEGAGRGPSWTAPAPADPLAKVKHLAAEGLKKRGLEVPDMSEWGGHQIWDEYRRLTGEEIA